MPRKHKNTTKHRAYVKPDYHSQNKKQPQNDSAKKNKLRTSYDIYKRLLHDPNIGINLNYVYIGYENICNTKELPILDWKMISNGGDIPMHRILYFVLYLEETKNIKIVIWDKKTKLDRLYCSGVTNKNTQSLKSLLSQTKTNYSNITHKQNILHNLCDIDEKKQSINKPQNQTLMMLDSLISTFSTNIKASVSKPVMCRLNADINGSHNCNQKTGFLFMGGSYNPVHLGHIKLMAVIKKYFEKNHNINVIGGYLVISTDKYVYAKLKDEAISFIHRKKLCELMCDENDLNWLHPSVYQCSSAIQYLKKEFSNKYPNALMINCMGADKILKNARKGKGVGKWRQYSKSLKNRKCLTVCINRKGYCDNAYKLYLSDVKLGLVNTNAFQFINVNVEQISSTLIRNILKDYEREINGLNENRVQIIFKKYKEKLREYLNEKSIDYLLNNINCIWSRK